MIAYLLTGAGAAALVMFGASLTWPVAYRAGRKATDDDHRIVEGVEILAGLPRRDPGATVTEDLGEPGSDQPDLDVVERVLSGLKGMDLPVQLGTLAEHGRIKARLPKLPVAAEGWATGTRFLPAELFTPTARVALTASPHIRSHRAPEPQRWQQFKARVRAWPLEVPEAFESWWRHSEHHSHHRLGEVVGARAQSARWNAPTGAHAVVEQVTEWDVEMERLVESQKAGVR